jgi:hypothetical protein
MMMDPSPCIYCGKSQKKLGREHVIPRAFGTFGELTPVLHCVCGDCNNFFSKEFEREVYRGSLEALQRWKRGLKSPGTKKEIDSRRVRLTAVGGEIDGLRLDPITNDVESQVEVRRLDTGELVQFTLEELRRLTPADAGKFDFLKHKLCVSEPAHHEQFAAEFLRLGFLVDSRSELKSIPMPVGTRLSAKLAVSMDTKTARAMGKISFNYLALVCGSEFVLRPDFDSMRDFIRQGKLPAKATVIAAGMQENARRLSPEHVAHFLTLHLDSQSTVYGRVIPFSGHTYHVALSMNFSPEAAPERLVSGIGHIFDFERKTVRPLPKAILDEWNTPSPT